MSDRNSTEAREASNIKKMQNKINSQKPPKIKNKRKGHNSRKNSNSKNLENQANNKRNYEKTKANKEKSIKNARDHKIIEFGAVSDVLNLPRIANLDNLSSSVLKSLNLDLNSTHEDQLYAEDINLRSSSGTPKAKSLSIDLDPLTQNRFRMSNNELCSLERTIERTPSPFVLEKSNKSMILSQRNQSVASSLSDLQADIFSSHPLCYKDSQSLSFDINTAILVARKSLNCSHSSYDSSVKGDVDNIPKHIKEKFEKMNRYIKELQDKSLGMDITSEEVEEIDCKYKSAKKIVDSLQAFTRTDSADTDDANRNIWASIYENDYSKYVYDQTNLNLKKLLLVFSEKLKVLLYFTKYKFTMGTENHEDIKEAICIVKKITHSVGDFYDTRLKLREIERDELEADFFDLTDNQLEVMKRIIAFIQQYQDKYVFTIDNLDPEKVQNNGLIEFTFRIETLNILYKGLKHVIYFSVECIKNDDLTRTIFSRFSHLITNAITSIIKLHNHIIDILDLELTDETIECNRWLIPLPFVCYQLALNILSKLGCISSNNIEDDEMYKNNVCNFKDSFYELSISSMAWMIKLLSKDISNCATSTIQKFFDDITLLRTFLINYGNDGSFSCCHGLDTAESDRKYERFKQMFLNFLVQNVQLQNLLGQKIADDSTRSTERSESGAVGSSSCELSHTTNESINNTRKQRIMNYKDNANEIIVQSHPVLSNISSDGSMIRPKPLDEYHIPSLCSNISISGDMKVVQEESERISNREMNESTVSRSTLGCCTPSPFTNGHSDIGMSEITFGIEDKGIGIGEDIEINDRGILNNNLIELNNVNESKDDFDSEIPNVESQQFRKVNNEDIRLLKQLGKGSYGSVYDAKYHGSPVAVKVLTGENGDQIRKKLFREMSMQRKLLHPNIISVYGTVEEVRTPEGLHPGIVMEKCSLGSLRSLLIKAEKLKGMQENIGSENNLGGKMEPYKIFYKSWHCRIRIACDIAAGLSYLHNRNLVHRDLTSTNVVLTSGNENRPIVAKLCDFAFSRPAPDAGIEKSLKFPNSPLYAAPEILNIQKYTSKADIYSFGLLLWEILTLEDPMNNVSHKDQNNMTVKHLLIIKDKIHDKQIVPLPEKPEPGIRDELFCSLKQLISICWNSKPEERPTSDEIRTYLEKILKFMEQDN